MEQDEVKKLKARIRLPLIEVPYVFAEAFRFPQLERLAGLLERQLIESGLLAEASS